MERMIDRKIEFVKASPLQQDRFSRSKLAWVQYAHRKLAAIRFHHVFGILYTFDSDKEGSELFMKLIQPYSLHHSERDLPSYRQ